MDPNGDKPRSNSFFNSDARNAYQNSYAAGFADGYAEAYRHAYSDRNQDADAWSLTHPDSAANRDRPDILPESFGQ